MTWTKDKFVFIGAAERASWIEDLKHHSINDKAVDMFRALGTSGSGSPFRVTSVIRGSVTAVKAIEIDGVSYSAESVGLGCLFLHQDRSLVKKVNEVKAETSSPTLDDETLLELLNTFHLHTAIRIGNVDVKNKKQLLAILKKRHRDALKSTELAASDLRKEISKKQEKLSLHEDNIKAMKNSLPG